MAPAINTATYYLLTKIDCSTLQSCSRDGFSKGKGHSSNLCHLGEVDQAVLVVCLGAHLQ